VQMEDGYLHPTINLDEPEPGFDLDFVPHVARPYDIEIGISNAFGFGGLNACVVVGRPIRARVDPWRKKLSTQSKSRS